MAQFTLVYKANGVVCKILDFKGCEFRCSVIKGNGGKKEACRPSFQKQAIKLFPYLEKDLLEALSHIDRGIELEKAIQLLQYYET